MGTGTYDPILQAVFKFKVRRPLYSLQGPTCRSLKGTG